jgi:hypothetical protein
MPSHRKCVDLDCARMVADVKNSDRFCSCGKEWMESSFEWCTMCPGYRGFNFNHPKAFLLSKIASQLGGTCFTAMGAPVSLQ